MSQLKIIDMEGGSEIDPERVVTNFSVEISGDLICPICMGILVDPKECVSQGDKYLRKFVRQIFAILALQGGRRKILVAQKDVQN